MGASPHGLPTLASPRPPDPSEPGWGTCCVPPSRHGGGGKALASGPGAALAGSSALAAQSPPGTGLLSRETMLGRDRLGDRGARGWVWLGAGAEGNAC